MTLSGPAELRGVMKNGGILNKCLIMSFLVSFLHILVVDFDLGYKNKSKFLPKF